MQVSAETRLWWHGTQCGAVERWFETLSALKPGGVAGWGQPAAPRNDVYLRDPGQTELGIKIRSAGTAKERFELKSLIAVRGEVAPFGPVTLWTKVASTALNLDGAATIVTAKLRRLRKFGWSDAGLREIALDEKEEALDGDRPDAGCNLEFTRVLLNGEGDPWWTLGYEAFGGIDEVERILRACTEHSLSTAPLPEADKATPASYPEWLAGRTRD